MRSALRATALLGTSSAIGIASSLVSQKILALVIGPNGIGLLGLYQSLFALTSMIASMGIGVALVRLVAGALTEGQSARVGELRGAAWLLTAVLGVLTVTLMLIFRTPIARVALGNSTLSTGMPLVGIALFLTLATNLQTSVLNAFHRVGSLTRVGILVSVVPGAVLVVLAWLRRDSGILPALVVGGLFTWAVTSFALRRDLRGDRVQLRGDGVMRAASDLLRFGAPYTASMIVGTGVTLGLPILALHALGPQAVGYYRAALAVSVNYLGFLLSAMALDYYPRIAGASVAPDILNHLVNQQQRLVMVLGMPIILGGLALAPFLIPLIYSARFLPTVSILEWQLIGDVFRFSSWTMSFVILARSGSRVFFATELASGITTATATWLGIRWFGLDGLGIGFLAGYTVYYLVVWGVTRSQFGLRWTTENRLAMLGSVLVVGLIRALPFLGLGSVRTPVALTFALLAGGWSVSSIVREAGGLRRIGNLFRGA